MPLTAAITGFGIVAICRITSRPASSSLRNELDVAVLLQAAHELDVAARAERASRAGDDDHAHVRVVLARAQRVEQILAHRAGERVELLGAIEGDRGDGVAWSCAR